jgi:hypothetical protein
MDIQSASDGFASFDKVKKSITQFTQQYDITYLLTKYIDRNYWVNELQRCLSVINVDNLTDFNYSKCFTYSINEGDLGLYLGEKNFNDYIIANGSLNIVHVMVSALGPYVVYKPVMYEYKNGKIILESIDTESEWLKHVDISMAVFCKRNNLFLVNDVDLRKTIDNVSLELHGPNPSVYNFLFEDGCSDFPY